ncbi:2'-5' RNA ligase family protein [Adhaeribacter rhizoryzae]|uniref:2'-5' RNA ligase family protein n=1 Tax=Adhaeribacter rhizoryzae TaxID=2607907 RepID=A0A5M6DJ36_9BACT|nr:2'-5' RNA ligase family protein [Adhaeribacter rhizoryzae]KAA5547473.1 2'-5' RNA ligase family protein [Adhaeribacter rhizoryzae]
MPAPPPLILTLQLDEPAFAFFNALRKKHFPANINYLDAHLTLFHHLPNNSAIPELLEKVAREQNIMPLEITAVIKLGRGVAYKIESEVLKQLQEYLKKQWQPWLTPQDQQGFRPHITVQNKVAVETARTLYEQLSANFQPFTAAGTGLSLWEYHGGPWQKVRDYDFRPSTPPN